MFHGDYLSRMKYTSTSPEFFVPLMLRDFFCISEALNFEKIFVRFFESSTLISMR